jgi:hypothetical protein
MSTPTIDLPHSVEDWEALLNSLSDEELREIYEAERKLKDLISSKGPQTDDELHAYIKEELGIDIPRTAVCPDHNAPFEAVADLFFERISACLIIGSRGGGKTFLIAILHWVNSLFKPGIESCSFAAQERQAHIPYSHLRSWIYDAAGNKKDIIRSSQMSETVFANGSKVKVLGSTESAVNGEHPNFVHGDELDLMAPGTFKESRNMSMSGTTTDGRPIIPQDVLTSTRKGPSGMVQQLVNEVEEAVRGGFKPPRKIYNFCIKEIAQERPECQRADPEARKARLTELNRNPNELCECHLIRKGVWPESQKDRTMDQICGGDFFKSRGHKSKAGVEQNFSENDVHTFETQQLNLKPDMQYHYVPEFNEAKHGIRNYVPDPANGPIYTSVDWGGTNPHSLHWYQVLHNEVTVDKNEPDPTSSTGWKRERVKEGTRICFDEIYKADIGNTALGNMAIEREKWWKRMVPSKWMVRNRFADPQGKGARLDWKNLGLVTSWHTTREFEEHVKSVRELFDDDLFRVAIDRCEMFVAEIKDWRRDEKTGLQIDYFNHAMSDFRYAMQNIKSLERKHNRGKGTPAAMKHRTPGGLSIKITKRGDDMTGPVGSRGKDSYSNWRNSLGAPVNRRGF